MLPAASPGVSVSRQEGSAPRELSKPPAHESQEDFQGLQTQITYTLISAANGKR